MCLRTERIRAFHPEASGGDLSYRRGWSPFTANHDRLLNAHSGQRHVPVCLLATVLSARDAETGRPVPGAMEVKCTTLPLNQRYLKHAPASSDILQVTGGPINISCQKEKNEEKEKLEMLGQEARSEGARSQQGVEMSARPGPGRSAQSLPPGGFAKERGPRRGEAGCLCVAPQAPAE